ncbi:MAG TPA: hypothetical protein DDX02_07905 [Clostridiaceae bacterium]|jgi:hypothetical protein|nr:hypothetical protein [Clostridiaceae bacterium]HBF77736.1 hypothetical protein [Clostridiaceae bacterium]HBG38138.1 hypothetical protein [Clostridiaceae bacterium]HBN27617.1 hypothetical protein [Clostridiaceae bacterium]HCL50939.1 hypothetical protein [Clostridiaceae bacterium]
MIQIDDAGSGSLVGGTLIGLLRVETFEFYYDIIPIEYFTTPFFENKLYLNYCTIIINEGLKYLKPDKNEKIEICQGYIFEKARAYLKQNSYNFYPTKIEEPLQSKIEDTFVKYAISLGIPENYLSYTKYPFHFHKLLRWVFADYETRKSLCKTGWKSWNKYKDVPLKRYTDYIESSNFQCLKCGKKINAPCKIKVIKFTTNKDYFIYLHLNCSSSQCK